MWLNLWYLDLYHLKKMEYVCEFCKKQLKYTSLNGHISDDHGKRGKTFVECNICKKELNVSFFLYKFNQCDTIISIKIRKYFFSY